MKTYHLLENLSHAIWCLISRCGAAKAQLVAAGCRTSDPEGSTWAGVVSRETVRLAAGVKTSTFGSEFLAMKACCEYLRGHRYKLRMMGISLEHPCFVYGDNKSVLCNTTMPDSMLKKKYHSVAYHFMREGCTRDEWRTTYINK